MTEKSQVADIDRSIYDIRDAEHDAYRMEAGLTPAIVEKLSKEKNDPAWMEQFRLESLQIYNNMRVPDWGAVAGRAGYRPHRDVCPPEHEDAEQLGERAAGH